MERKVPTVYLIQRDPLRFRSFDDVSKHAYSFRWFFEQTRSNGKVFICTSINAWCLLVDSHRSYETIFDIHGKSEFRRELIRSTLMRNFVSPLLLQLNKNQRREIVRQAFSVFRFLCWILFHGNVIFFWVPLKNRSLFIHSRVIRYLAILTRRSTTSFNAHTKKTIISNPVLVNR